MGSYLDKLGPSPWTPGSGRADARDRLAPRRPARPLYQLHRVQRVHRAQPARRSRPARRPPDWDPANPAAFVSEAWRRFPMKRIPHNIMGPLPSDWWESYLKRNIWSLRHPRATWSPVTITISPPEQRSRPSFPAAGIVSSGGAPEEPPEKDSVLRALRECRKGRARSEESLPLSPESPTAPGTGQSAFKPMSKNGARVCFVPRPGPLKRSLHSQSEHELKRPNCCCVGPSAGTRSRGPVSARRNAISSSYSSSREFSEPCKRRLSRAPIRTPEWPLKKRGNFLYALATSADTGQSDPGLLSSPRGLRLPKAEVCRHGPAEAENRTLKTQAGQSNKNCEDSTGETRPGGQPPLPLNRPSSGSAPAICTNSRLGSSKTKPALCGGLQSEPLERPPTDSQPTATSILQVPGSPTSPVTEPTWSPSAPQAHRSAMPPHSSVTIPAAPATQSAPFGKRSSPTTELPVSVPFPEISAHSVVKKTILGSLFTSETEGSLCPKMSATAAASANCSLSTVLGTVTPTFKAIFGSVVPLKTMPVVAPVVPRQPSPPFLPASHLLPHLTKATSMVLSSTPASIPKDPTFKSPLDISIVKVTNTMSNVYSVPSSRHPILLGAGQGFSPATDVIFPCQHPTVPTVHTVTVFSQVLPSAIQIAPLGSTSSLKGVGNPGSTSGSAPSVSHLTSTLTPPLGSSLKPSFSLSVEGSSQPVLGATGKQKRSSMQPPLTPSPRSFSLSEKSSAFPSPGQTPVQPVPGPATPPVAGGLTGSTSTLPKPASVQPGSGGSPAAFPFGEPAPSSLMQRGACGSVFGSTAPRPFAFGGLVTPMDCGEPEAIVAAPPASNPGAEPRRTPNTVARLAQSWGHSTQGRAGQTVPLSLARTSVVTARKTVLGVPSLAAFAQGTPIPVATKSSSNLGLGVSSPAAQGSVGKDPFRAWAPSFCIGVKSKTPRSREPGRPRRHHVHKK